MNVSKTDPAFQEFLHAYLRAALDISVIADGENEEMDGDFFSKHFDVNDFDPSSLEQLEAHAFSFWSRAACYMPHESPKRTAADAGHDFWLTQTGQGAGFWDGDWPKNGELLTKLAKCYPDLHLFVADDGISVGVE